MTAKLLLEDGRTFLGEAFGAHTRIADLPDKVILGLAQPGDASSTAFYELIMGVLDLGPAAKFFYLSNDEQMRVVDIHLLLADQVRFEMMRRIEAGEIAPHLESEAYVQFVRDHAKRFGLAP